MPRSLPPKAFVLYADDDAEDRELVREAFHHYSNTVEFIGFENGVELLGYLNAIDNIELHPCLIILDINMPFISGKEVLHKIRKEDRFDDIPVILFSTSTLPSEIAFAQSLDAGFLTKPLLAHDIYELVDKMVDHCGDDIRDYLREQKRS